MMEDLRPIIESKNIRPIIIAGPCSAETEDQVMCSARAISSLGIGIFRAGIWKPRTKPGGFEGVGLPGLKWLQRVKSTTGMKVITEVATPAHIEAVLSHDIDMVWIGARTSSSPFAMQEIADEFRKLDADIPVFVKNPVSPDLELWIGAMERLYDAGIHRLAAIHRGFAAYDDHTYRNHPQWRIPLDLRIRYPKLPIICDPSHIGGRRELVFSLSQHALDIGFDGLIIECHCQPDKAWSDAAQQLTPVQLNNVLHSLVFRNEPVAQEELTLLRNQIDQLDAELLGILGRRMEVSRKIGEYKRQRNMPIIQPRRFDRLSKNLIKESEKLGMSERFIRSVLSAIHEESVRLQIEHSPD